VFGHHNYGRTARRDTYTAGGAFGRTTVELDGSLDVRSAFDASAFSPLWCDQLANVDRGRWMGWSCERLSYITGVQIGAMCEYAQESYDE
jgi:hypothetical protein